MSSKHPKREVDDEEKKKRERTSSSSRGFGRWVGCCFAESNGEIRSENETAAFDPEAKIVEVSNHFSSLHKINLG
uniref:Uncharacterized protein n=1 Tax=Tarenaya spinosa TaxID=228870 RepID=Q1KUZ4_9ROSI|nr:hypothetical protein [Tarenaya spinosa]